MPSTLPAGPYRTLKTVEGQDFPYYIVPFDADGVCQGPKTREHLLEHAHGYSDVFVFSHGWNNDWTVATRRYETFIEGVQKLRRDMRLPAPAGFRPLLVGIFWPSQALEWFEDETGPDIAAADPAQRLDAEASQLQSIVAEIAAQLPQADRPRFYQLTQSESLGKPEAMELASLLARQLVADDEGVRADAPKAEDLLAAAISLVDEEPDYDAVRVIDQLDPAGHAAGGPQAAFGLGGVVSALDPRKLLKPFTVWQMKDRAGKVGAAGVSELLVGLLQNSTARVHLLGHSYGCKVMMTALCVPASLPRNVESALLLQPAVSQYVFAQNVPKRNVPGGFFKAVTRVNLPILSTFSARDVPLTKLFHLAVRRHDDLGELQYAADGSPSNYGALGGFGPQATAARTIDIQAAGKPYELAGAERVIALRGSAVISGHGDISRPETWWALYCLMTASGN